MTPSGIEPVNFRFVAQHLNHCATAEWYQLQFPAAFPSPPGKKNPVPFEYAAVLATLKVWRILRTEKSLVPVGDRIPDRSARILLSITVLPQLHR